MHQFKVLSTPACMPTNSILLIHVCLCKAVRIIFSKTKHFTVYLLVDFTIYSASVKKKSVISYIVSMLPLKRKEKHKKLL